jgi:hypothetical protein
MTWTSEKPTVPGWYWWRHGGCERIRYVHAVGPAAPYQLRIEAPDGWFDDIENVGGKWSGPLPPPTEPFDGPRFEQAPCYLCGYNNGGYYQPEQHPCAARYHAWVEEQP